MSLAYLFVLVHDCYQSRKKFNLGKKLRIFEIKKPQLS